MSDEDMTNDEEIFTKIKEFIYEQVSQRVLSSPAAAWDTLDMGKDLLQMYLLLRILEQLKSILESQGDIHDELNDIRQPWGQ